MCILEMYLEELSDHIEDVSVECQTDMFLDKPATPLFIPAKTGRDAATQIEEGEVQYGCILLLLSVCSHTHISTHHTCSPVAFSKVNQCIILYNQIDKICKWIMTNSLKIFFWEFYKSADRFPVVRLACVLSAAVWFWRGGPARAAGVGGKDNRAGIARSAGGGGAGRPEGPAAGVQGDPWRWAGGGAEAGGEGTAPPCGEGENH